MCTCTVASPEITCVMHAMKALRMFSICGKGVMVEDSLTSTGIRTGPDPISSRPNDKKKMVVWPHETILHWVSHQICHLRGHLTGFRIGFTLSLVLFEGLTERPKLSWWVRYMVCLLGVKNATRAIKWHVLTLTRTVFASVISVSYGVWFILIWSCAISRSVRHRHLNIVG